MHHCPCFALVMDNTAKALIADLRRHQDRQIDQTANGIARLEKQLKDIVDALNDLYVVISDMGN